MAGSGAEVILPSVLYEPDRHELDEFIRRIAGSREGDTFWIAGQPFSIYEPEPEEGFAELSPEGWSPPVQHVQLSARGVGLERLSNLSMASRATRQHRLDISLKGAAEWNANLTHDTSMTSSTVFASGPGNRSMPAATVIPVLQYPDVTEAAAWLCRAFGVTERLRIGSHRIQMMAGDGAFVIAAGPSGTQPAGQSLMVRVRSADEHHAMAKAAGAEVLGAPQSQPYGERQYTARDLAGHIWTFSESEADIHPAQWGGELVAAEGNAAV